METQFKKKMFTFSLSVSVFLASSGTSMANVSLPSISAAFDVSFSSVRWVVLGYLIAITLLSLMVGRLADRVGRGRVLTAGVLLFAVGSMICAIAPSVAILIAARIIQGAGGAALVVLPLTIADEFSAVEQRGRVIGLLASMSAVGTASGPALGGLLLSTFGWRAPFSFLAVVTSVVFWLTLKFVPRSRLARVNKREQTSFVRELRSLFREPTMRTLLLSNLVFSVVMMSTLITGPFYLTNALHIDADLMGLLMSVGPVTSIFAGYVSGRLVDRFGALAMIKVGLIELFVGAVSFIFLPARYGAIGFALAAAALSLGYQISLAANSVRLMSVVESEQRGFASGALSLMRNLGLMTGTMVIGGVFDSFSKDSPTRGLQAAFAVSAAIVSTLLVHLLKNQRGRTDERAFTEQIC